MFKNESKKQKKRIVFDFRSYRFRLTAAFVVFALVLMGLLWVLQIVFMQAYYEKSIQGRTEAGMGIVSSIYANTENLDAETFYRELSAISRENDIFFFIETEDSTVTISSAELGINARRLPNFKELVKDARKVLDSSTNKTISMVHEEGSNVNKSFTVATRVESPYRSTVYMYAVVLLIPMENTISILASQLMLVTMVSLLLGALIAFSISTWFAGPIKGIKNKAKMVAAGDYTTRFDEKSGSTETRDLAATLNDMTTELSKSEALQKDLLANISHDLRTPLTMIKSYAEMIRDISGDNKEKRDEHLGVITDEVDRLSKLVGDILLLSKMQSGTFEMEEKPVDIQKAALSVLSVYKVLEDQDGYKFTFEQLEGVSPYVMGDESRLQQVFSNLISNAVHYSEDNKNIIIKFDEPENNKIRFRIRDHGMGIAPEDLPNIWDRYQRASKTGTRARTGTGLGLSITKEILEHHGAEYGVESIVGEGSCFWFTLDCKFVVDTQ